MECLREKKVYPLDAAAYRLLEEIGQGVSATVYRAICLPCNEVVAVKSLDLEKCTSNLDEIRREAQTMSLICHPNVVKAHCSFVVDHSLWVVMPYLAGGSCLHVMKASYPDGFEEPVIATVLKESLKALDYLHRHGLIHRDVKAGNILVDGNGTVKLGDFGVSACMFDTGDRQRSRNTFVGTPCWMAPEVMEQVHGYDFKADIWSFGITALELAHGHAPFSKYPPMKVLLMTLQNAPPGLDYERDKRFSKSFKEMIAMCLVKDPARRPSAEKLLKHSFFRNARSYEYVARHLLDGLPALGARVKNLKLKDATRLAQKKMPYGEQQERSQNEYKRGVSCWNFNVEDLKAEAAFNHDDAFAVVSREETQCDFRPPEEFALTQITSPKLAVSSDPLNLNLRGTNHCLEAEASLDACEPLKRKGAGSAVLHLRGRFDLVEDDVNTGRSTRPEDAREPCLSREVTKDQPRTDVEEMYMLDDRVEGAGKEHRRVEVKEVDSDRLGRSAIPSGGQEINEDSDKDHCQLFCAVEDSVCCNVAGSDRALGGHSASSIAARATSDQVLFVDGRLLASRSSTRLKDGVEEKSKEPHVQRKGRFSVTSEIVDQLENAFLRKSASTDDWSCDRKHDAPTLSSTSSQSPAESSDAFIPTGAIVPHLRNILQQATIQEDLLVNLICSMDSPDTTNGRRLDSVGSKFFPRTVIQGNDDSGVELVRDRDLCQQVAEQRSRIAYLVDELEGLKLRNIRLERQVLLASRCFIGPKDGIEQKSQGPFVQRKGRFSVTSEDVKQVDDTLLQMSPSVGDYFPERRHTGLLQSTFSQLPVSNWITAIPTGAILPRLQNILHQATIQQDLLVNLILSIKTCDNSNSESPGSHGQKRFSRTASVGRSESSVDITSDKDQDLHHLVFELQGRIADLCDDLKVTKLTNIQLEHQWNSMSNKEEERIHRMEA